MNTRDGRFPLFDSLRAVAALSVLGFHAAFLARVFVSDSFLRPYLSHLDVGVTIFFLISGFLLYRPFARARLRGEAAPRTGPYAWRRFLRIVPAYWVALTVIALWLGLSYVFSARGAPVYYGFAQIYFADRAPGGIGQAWTLCVEITFYAVLPLWALLMRRIGGGVRRELVALGLLWVASFAYKVWALRQAGPNDLRSAPYLQPLPNFLDQFAIGMGLALLSVHWEERGRLPAAVEALRRRSWLPLVLTALAFWAVSTQIGFTGELLHPYTNRMFLARHELYTLVALGLVVPAILAEPGRGLVGRVLGSRVMAYLGLVSYAIYLYHFAILKKIDEWLGGPLDAPFGVRLALYAALGTAAATLVATASYYAVERPALRLRRLVPSRASSATAASTASATSAGWRKRGTP